MAHDNPVDKTTKSVQRRAEQARYRAELRAHAYYTMSGMFRIDPAEHHATLRMVARWLVLGSGAGILAGTASAAFLVSLQSATAIRLADPRLLFLLRLAGLLLGWVYHRLAGAAARRNHLVSA